MLIICKLIVFQIPCRQGQFLESPIAPFFPRLRVSHYPQFIRAANSGFVTACVLYLQTWAWTWSTVPESDESGGKVGSCLHCLQIKSSDSSINPQTVRHNVEKSFLQDFSFSLAKEVFLENQVIGV